MTQQLQILWVDDEKEDREPDKENIERKNDKLEIKLIHPNDLLESLKKEKPDLFLIDFYLNRRALVKISIKGKSSEKYPYKGLTADSIIREKCPDIPIYCTSSYYKTLQKDPIFYLICSSFDRFLDFNNIQNQGHEILYFDALDFKRIRESGKQGISSILSLLAAPEEEHEKLKLTLPSSLRQGLYQNKEGNSLVLAKWINNVLFQNPGILYDDLFSATFLGIKLDDFKGIAFSEDKIKTAQYKGIFSKTNTPFWWKSKLLQNVFSFEKIAKYPDKSPCVVAPDMLKIPKKSRTKCIVCGKEYPECVGINLTNSSDCSPVHIRCSEPYIKRKTELYFEEYRGFKTS
jgi:CheY-like chemotaxis protein